MAKNLGRKIVKRIGVMACIMGILNLGGMTGCGGDSEGGTPDVNVGTGTGDPVADTTKTISDTMGSAFQGVNSIVSNSSQTIQCDSGGQATVSGDASTGNPITFDLDADFENCAGLDGGIEVSGEFFADQTDFNGNFSVNGTVGVNGCALEFNDFGADLSQGAEALSFLLTGNVSATCGSAAVTCDFNGVNSQDLNALQAACSCSGSGC